MKKRATHTIPGPGRRFYICSLSTSTIVYKGQFTADQLWAYYLDLAVGKSKTVNCTNQNCNNDVYKLQQQKFSHSCFLNLGCRVRNILGSGAYTLLNKYISELGKSTSPEVKVKINFNMRESFKSSNYYSLSNWLFFKIYASDTLHTMVKLIHYEAMLTL